MLTSNLRKTVLAVAALALCPTLAFALPGTDTAKPMTAPAMTTQTAAPAAKVAKTAVVKTHKTTKVAQLAKPKHHSKMARAKTKAKAVKTAALSTGGALKAKTAAK
ncbi:MAG: acid-shock protein [Rhizomicrobium sp.]|jgi:hypothetical protein